MASGWKWSQIRPFTFKSIMQYLTTFPVCLASGYIYVYRSDMLRTIYSSVRNLNYISEIHFTDDVRLSSLFQTKSTIETWWSAGLVFMLFLCSNLYISTLTLEYIISSRRILYLHNIMMWIFLIRQCQEYWIICKSLKCYLYHS